jgi:hypothetical protein
MNEQVAALVAALEEVYTPFLRGLSDEELRRLYEELDTALLFVRHERQRREENAE